MENEYAIRAARNHDAQTLFMFLCKLEDQFFDKEQFLANYQSCMAGKDNIYLVAVGLNNIPVGFISCHGQLLLHHGGIVYEIQELFVDAAHRGKGIGHALLKALDEKLYGVSYESLEVSTTSWQMEARKCYTDHGFKQTHLKYTRPRH